MILFTLYFTFAEVFPHTHTFYLCRFYIWWLWMHLSGLIFLGTNATFFNMCVCVCVFLFDIGLGDLMSHDTSISITQALMRDLCSRVCWNTEHRHTLSLSLETWRVKHGCRSHLSLPMYAFLTAALARCSDAFQNWTQNSAVSPEAYWLVVKQSQTSSIIVLYNCV